MFNNITKNVMGIEFTAKLGNMRKEQTFVVYSRSPNNMDQIHIQSESRYGIIVISKSTLILSANHSNGANSAHLTADMIGHKTITQNIPNEDLHNLLNAMN